MPQDDLNGLRAVLREAVAACRRSSRDMEEELGLGHGSLQRLLDGRIDIRVQHLLAIARLLQIHPVEFLELGFPEWPARYRLIDWMGPDQRKRAAGKSGLPTTREELAELIRGIVREELDAQPRKS